MFKRSIFAAAVLLINSSLFAVGPVSHADYIGFHHHPWGDIRSQSIMQTKLQSWDPDLGNPSRQHNKTNFHCACVTGQAFA